MTKTIWVRSIPHCDLPDSGNLMLSSRAFALAHNIVHHAALLRGLKPSRRETNSMVYALLEHKLTRIYRAKYLAGQSRGKWVKTYTKGDCPGLDRSSRGVL